MRTIRRHVARWAPLAAACVLALTAGRTSAAPGDLDPTFGDGGVVASEVGRSHAWAHSLVQQADGQIVAAGRTFVEVGRRVETEFVLARYGLDGTPDESFGVGGTVVQRVGGGHFYRTFLGEGGLVIQDDGKLLMTGNAATNSANVQFAVMRVDAEGRPDESFGQAGIVRTGFAGGVATPVGLLLTPDGKVLTGGSSFNPRDEFDEDDGRWEFSVARYQADGRPDGSFSDDGRVRSSGVGNLDAHAQAIVMQPDGKAVLCGFVTGPDEPFPLVGFMLARYDDRGRLDRDFGEAGKVRERLGEESGAFAVALAADGKLIAGGQAGDAENLDFALMRFHPDGSVDRAFGTDGAVVTPIGSDRVALISSLAIQADGRILAGGYAQRDGRFVFAIARYDADGNLDASFGNGGVVETPLSDGDSFLYALLIQRDGTLVAAGETLRGGRGQFTVVRYLLESEPGLCIGDCDASGTVGITELISGVRQALGSEAVRACLDANGNGMIDISELIAAVANASGGCPQR